jgi:hypothetical protein
MENGIFALIPIMALAIPVSAIVFSSLLKLQRLRLEEARLRAGDTGDGDGLARQVESLARELADVQERLDFAERLLAQGRETRGLPGAAVPNQSP